MIRRLGLSVLWFLGVWTAAAMATFASGLPAWIVPIAALVGAAAMLRPMPDIRRAAPPAGTHQKLAGR